MLDDMHIEIPDYLSLAFQLTAQFRFVQLLLSITDDSLAWVVLNTQSYESLVMLQMTRCFNHTKSTAFRILQEVLFTRQHMLDQNDESEVMSNHTNELCALLDSAHVSVSNKFKRRLIIFLNSLRPQTLQIHQVGFFSRPDILLPEALEKLPKSISPRTA